MRFRLDGPNAGHQVRDPQTLPGGRTTTVVITNPAYTDEIAKSLADLGLDARLLVAWTTAGAGP